MKAAIIYNPRAGPARADAKVRWAADELRARGWDVDIHSSRRPGQMHELAQTAAAAGVEALFAAGGDGTVGAAAEAIGGTPARLGVLPLGTANVWAAQLGLPLGLNSRAEAQACLAAQLDGAVRTVDMGAALGRKFLLWSGVGLDAHVVGKVDPRPDYGKRLGVIYFYMAGLRAALSFRGAPMTLRAENGTVSGTLMMALAANIGRYAGTHSILDPASRPDDGLLEFWTMAGETMFDGLRHLTRYKFGRHTRHPGIRRLQGRAVEVECRRPMPIHFDGETMTTVTHVRYEVLPAHLHVYAPARNTSAA